MESDAKAQTCSYVKTLGDDRAHERPNSEFACLYRKIVSKILNFINDLCEIQNFCSTGTYYLRGHECAVSLRLLITINKFLDAEEAFKIPGMKIFWICSRCFLSRLHNVYHIEYDCSGHEFSLLVPYSCRLQIDL